MTEGNNKSENAGFKEGFKESFKERFKERDNDHADTAEDTARIFAGAAFKLMRDEAVGTGLVNGVLKAMTAELRQKDGTYREGGYLDLEDGRLHQHCHEPHIGDGIGRGGWGINPDGRMGGRLGNELEPQKGIGSSAGLEIEDITQR
jgi:hypothetical protein